MADEPSTGLNGYNHELSAGGAVGGQGLEDGGQPVPSAPLPVAGTKLLDTAAVQDKRSKKQQGKKRGRGGASAQEEIPLTAAQADHLRIVRVEGRKDPQNDDRTSPVVLLSKVGHAPQLQLSDDRLSVKGVKGFRTARTTHGAYSGTWYCEATVTRLGPTGHVRLGWVTRRGELQAPVGFDKWGFSYRDVDGSKVHQGLREAYGKGYAEGDVVGLFLHLPEGGRPCEAADRAVARFKGALYFVDEMEPEPKPLQGSVVAFTLNGELQGVAYRDILEGTYYPAASLYTLPTQTDPATVNFNFGPDFKHPPPQVEDLPAARPVSELPQVLQAAAAAAAAEAATAVPGSEQAVGGVGQQQGEENGTHQPTPPPSDAPPVPGIESAAQPTSPPSSTAVV